MAIAQQKSEQIALALDGQTYRLGELFAGAGGMALGAHLAEWRGNRFSHTWVNDVDRDACNTFRHNLPITDKGVFCCDVEKLDFKRLPRIDGLIFGFPCNDFSVVGDRHGISGEYGGLYRWGVHGLETQRPLFFIAENVGGLASSGDDLNIIQKAMERAGYRIFPNKYRFEEYGVPQNRHRLIIVGFRNDTGVHKFDQPDPTTLNKRISCREALQGISPDTPNNEKTAQSKVVVERLKHIRPGQNAFNANLPDRLKLAMKSKATISQIYRRLIPDQPAYTVTGSGGGGTHVYHWEEPRALTNRERARLQSFPDDFEFQGSKESVRKQIGMAVPPEGAKHIFTAVLKTLREHGISSQC